MLRQYVSKRFVGKLLKREVAFARKLIECSPIFGSKLDDLAWH